MNRYLTMAARGIALPWILSLTGGLAGAGELQEPITLSSDHGVLDILMVARSWPITTFPSFNPTAWAYEICKRPANGATSCPAAGANYYGGTLLQLQKGDLLKIHLVNQLPLVLDSKHATEPGREYLKLNPTNLHTHGMLVSAHGSTPSDPTFGDNVFVLTFNSANGKPQQSPHMHSVIRYDSTDYSIQIPKNHPSGLFWFHPHAHGLALNQASAGLAGVMTVGKLSDYVNVPGARVRTMILKDTQILKNSSLQDQQDPGFCAGLRTPNEGPRLGSCAGQNNKPDGEDYTGGKWFFTVNGQAFPTVSVKNNSGEIWRITNTSGSATRNLTLWNAAQNKNMLFQVLAVDGVSVSVKPGVPVSSLAGIAGSKFDVETCPAGGPPTGGTPLCTRRILMMPSSRVEVWVTYRDANDAPAPAPPGAQAIFQTANYVTGPIGDSWPTVQMAQVNFLNTAAAPSSVAVHGEAAGLLNPVNLASDMQAANRTVAPDVSCAPLAPGHMRRIFYAAPTTDPSAFGLAYEEIDENGNVVGPPATDVTAFDPMHATVCVTLGAGNTPAVERWQVVNVAGEDHNFHLHQVKFRVLTPDDIGGTGVPQDLNGKVVMLDNVPLPHANGTCGNNPPTDPSNPIADWRAGLCHARPVTVEIPFTIAGDYVYHCHIFEHEDGGMMARIRVRPHQ